MIIKRQKEFSVFNSTLGAISLGSAGAMAGNIVGANKGLKKATEEEKKEAAERKIKENNAKIKYNNEAREKLKATAKKEREKIGPEKNWDDLDRIEIEMMDEAWKKIPEENKKLKKQNEELKKGDYTSIRYAADTPTGRKYQKRGTIIGAGAGAALGILAGCIIK